MPEISELMARPAPERFDGAEAWTKIPAAAQAAIGAIALELTLAWHLQDAAGPGVESALPPVAARVAGIADSELMAELEATVVDALPEGAFTAADGGPRIPSLVGGVCRSCGCSQNDACAVGCAWAAEDLCTACVVGGAE
ncbi:hypothetical protein ACN9MF_11645 [Methylobacterium fujisawaense]|uniref:hypothetical protein n=1 Tax=Methylobacterium fujisawaense TaxID=107400 RepID=UPI003CF94D03